MKILWVAILVSLACANPVKDCRDCSSVRNARSVCGTDQKTYASRCHMHRAACLTGAKIGVLHNGNCTGLTCSKQDLDAFGDRLVAWIGILKNNQDPEPIDQLGAAETVKSEPEPEPESEPSLNSPRKKLVYWMFDRLDVVYDRFLSRKEFLELEDLPYEHCARPFFDTRCDSNGDEEISLHEWCVCLGLDDADIEPYNDVCTVQGLAEFNDRLVHEFNTEYQEAGGVAPTAPSDFRNPQPEAEPRKLTAMKKFIYWKFDVLDVNPYSRYLDPDELNGLTRYLQRNIRPYGCANTFIRRCDVDKDYRIGLHEWCKCLGLDKDGNPVDVEPTAEVTTAPKATPKPNVCTLEAETGRCKAALPRYYYDSSRLKCVQFMYGGCGGNGNNFETSGECAKACLPKKECAGDTLANFNREVLVFVEKMKRGMSQDLTVPPFVGDPKPEPEHQIFSPEKRLIYWLWDRLDVSPHDDVLVRKEVQEYFTQLSSSVKSRQCFKDYFSRCDRNSDSRISLAEWCFCHGLDSRCPAVRREDFNRKILAFISNKKDGSNPDLTVPPFHGEPRPEPELRLKTPEKKLVYWMWDRLDVFPHDDFITSVEFSSYYTEIRILTPFSCGASYFSYCDRNNDSKISLSEWCFCHGLDNTCPAANLRLFNLNVLEHIRLKKERSTTVATVPPFVGEPKPESEPRLKSTEKRLIYWQWDLLDISPHDDYLTRGEVLSYLTDVRVKIEPFGCGLNYFNRCDHNSDDKISLAEWCFCHGLDNVCPADSRRRFNGNILDYIQVKKDGMKRNLTVPPFEGEPKPESEPTLKRPEKILVYWQWDLLDISPHDDYLTKAEVSAYMDDVRVTVEPFGCGLDYFEHCDRDSDSRISLAEWCFCHGLDNTCPADNRRRFNANILDYIRLDKQRTPDDITVPPFDGEPEPESEPQLKTAEKILIYWQWDRLDVSPHDDYLTKAEMSSYLAIVRTRVEPLGCGLNYFDYCDRNSDNKVSLSEWCFCHGLDNTCPASNRRRFNVNVLEYIQLQKEGTTKLVTPPPFEGEPKPESEPQIKMPEKILVYWQWDLLDVSPHDDYLTKAEVGTYMSRVRMAVEPFGCGLTYFDYCDKNSDSRISLAEWCFCHGLDNKCPVHNRRRFNLNVLDYIKQKKQAFQGDFVVPPFEGDPQPESEPRIKTPEKRMIYWQWDLLDIGPHDDYLTWEEVREYLGDVRRVVEPFGCGISYWHHLDYNHDGRITLNEWCYGHGLDPNITLPGKSKKLHRLDGKGYSYIRDKNCSTTAREYFNENLLAKIALSYFIRHSEQECGVPTPEPKAGAAPEPEAEPRIRTPEKKLVYWQWDQLDTSPHDEYLDHTEVDDYVMSVARKVCPYSCGKDLFAYCDVDDDDRISRHEWCYCLGQDNEPDPIE